MQFLVFKIEKFKLCCNRGHFDVLNVLGAPGLDQIFGDPDAADIVFTSGADVLAVGINVTHQVVMTGNPLCHLHVYFTEYYYICAIYVYIIFLRINYLWYVLAQQVP